MDNEGQIINIGITIVIAIAIFFAMSLFLQPLMNLIAGSRIDLNCATPGSITDGNKLICLGLDAIIPYFIIGALSIAGSIIIMRFAG